MNLSSSVLELKGVGDKTEQLLEKMGVYTVKDILLHFPYNYVFYPEPVAMEDITEDTLLAFRATIATKPYYKGGRLQMVTVTVTDGIRKLPLLWYHMPYIRHSLSVNDTCIFYGKVRMKNDRLQMEQPAVFSEEEYKKKQQSLEPVYHLTKGMSNNAFGKLASQCVQFAGQMQDYLSEDIKARRNLVDLSTAYIHAHFPTNLDDLLAARKRLAFDEFFLFLLKVQLLKSQKVKSLFQMHGKEQVIETAKNLPFTLTQGQEAALNDILQDMSGDTPMQRLLQGDVGSGKTILAFLSMLYCAGNGYQSALMAPTEVLARQHYDKLLDFCREHCPYVNVYLLTGSIPAGEKRKIKQALLLDETAMVVGTHALLTEDVTLHNLGLVITDEQHRFGVNQRQTLSEKGQFPHILVMSATPIPRTLAIILYGDLDISVIKAVPQNRLPIKNCVVKRSYRKTAYEFMYKQISEGHQIYIICPLVEESEGMDGADVLSYIGMLKQYYQDTGREVSIECLHGKMRPRLKNEIMERFAKGEISILISTTVIEVGVDVPNATVMMIENAERFGLAQLHQLRGRVGRGSSQAYCIFMDGKPGKEKNKRLEILNQSNDGFYIAEEDLKLRGPGDVFGIRQSGEMDFRIADIYHDAELLKDASWEAKNILEKDRTLSNPEHEALIPIINL